jgi:hypothetical protein
MTSDYENPSPPLLDVTALPRGIGEQSVTILELVEELDEDSLALSE